MKLQKKLPGFTLIELLIVIIIVAILAAVGLSILRGNTDAARLSEGVSNLGTIRTAMRARFAQDTVYPAGAGFGTGNNIQASGIGFNVGDLCGRFFGDAQYVWGAPGTAATFCARVTGSGLDEPLGCPTGPVKGSAVPVATVRTMNQDGDIFANGTCAPPRIN